MFYNVPFRIGQLVYYIQNGKKWLYEVEEIRIKKDGITLTLYNPAAPAIRKTANAKDFGNTIFLYYKEKEKESEPHPSEFATHIYGYSNFHIQIPSELMSENIQKKIQNILITELQNKNIRVTDNIAEWRKIKRHEDDIFWTYECTHCTAYAPVTKTYYCPNCGYRMLNF